MILAAATLWAGAIPTDAQSPEGYRSVEPEFLPTSLEESYHDGRFTIAVDRQFRGAEERVLVERAESLIPPEHLILTASDSVLSRFSGAAGQWQRNFDRARALPGERWWWIEWDQVLLPFALTGRAVSHYMDRVRHLATVPNPYPRDDEDVPPHRASFEYDAVVVAIHSGGHVVELTMRWSFWCGRLCALWFHHTRTVEFDANGDVISITGDHPPSYGVS